jgi:hypothetical protein
MAKVTAFKALLERLEYVPHPWAKLPSIGMFKRSMAASEGDGEIFVAFEVYGPKIELRLQT